MPTNHYATLQFPEYVPISEIERVLDIDNLTEEQRDAYIQTKGGGRKLLNACAILLCSIHHSIISSLYLHIHRFDSNSCVGKKKAKAKKPNHHAPSQPTIATSTSTSASKRNSRKPRHKHEVTDFRQSGSAEINLDIREQMQHSNKLLRPEEIEKIPNAAVRKLEHGQRSSGIVMRFNRSRLLKAKS
jgi:hypothetical protein